MIKLRTILQSKLFVIISFIFIIFYILVFTKVIKYNSKYEDGSINLILNVIKYSKKDDKTIIYFKGKEKIVGKIYDDNIDIHIGDTFFVSGTISTPNNNTIPNTFNYKKYLYNKKIYKIINISSLKKVDINKNIFNKLKDKMIEKANNNEYLLLFIVGDKSLLNSDIYNAYKNIGVAHLLAISGMHISLFVKILDKIFKYLNKHLKNIIILLVLFFYIFLVSFSPSVIRVFIFYLLGLINEKYLLNLNKLKRLYFCFLIMVLLNPFYIYDISFIYSYTVVFGIIFSSKYLNHNYLFNLFLITIIAMLFSFPITINLNYEINLISIIANLLLVPFVTFIIYPLCLITFIFPFFTEVLNFLTNIMEIISNYLNQINILTFNIPKINVVFIIIYYLLLISFVYFNKKRFLFLLALEIFFIKVLVKLDSSLHVIYFDVGQGDSAAIILPHKKDVFLIDSGGSIYYNPSDNIILYLKSIGVSKINIIASHGDNDHIGDIINILNSIKVENIIFNCGSYNELEENIIDVANKNNINYKKCIKALNINGYKFKFLNTGVYDDENANSQVVYFKYLNYSFLFMGDADKTREYDILNNYNINNVTFLKIGHHGSNTSSSEYFIKSIKPKYSLISVGKNNIYGHPKDNVLKNLQKINSTIYRTDIDGSIEVKIKSDGYSIETCEP